MTNGGTRRSHAASRNRPLEQEISSATVGLDFPAIKSVSTNLRKNFQKIPSKKNCEHRGGSGFKSFSSSAGRNFGTSSCFIVFRVSVELSSLFIPVAFPEQSPSKSFWKQALRSRFRERWYRSQKAETKIPMEAFPSNL